MNTEPGLTGGTLLARQLVEEGVTHLFGIPGVQLDYATNGLSTVADDLQFVIVRHEQTATYAADGYARSTGRVGVGLVVPGPGVLNAGAGLVTALACSSPILLLAGQVPSRGIGKGLGLLHEIPDQSGLLDQLGLGNTLVTDPGEVAGAVHGALVQLSQGPGPLTIEIPPDILRGRSEGHIVGAEPAASPRPGPDNEVAAAAERLAAAERPVIFAGGGAAVSSAWDSLHQLAETLGAPMVSTTNGKGSFDDRHPLAVLPLGHKELLQRADVVLFVGTRGLDGRGQPLATAADAKTISINRDERAFEAPRAYDVTVTGDAAATCSQLAGMLGEAREPWCHDIDAIREWIAAELAPLEPQGAYVAAIRDALPDDAVLVNELTQVGYVARQAYQVRHPRSYIDPGYQGTLGYGYPTAIGAAVGNPDRPVVSLNGDGGFGYGLAELATAAQYDLGLVAVVFADGAYGNVRRMHVQAFDGAHYGTDLTNPDFVALAKAFGVAGSRAESPDALRTALDQAIESGGPALIEVPMDVVPDPWEVMMRPWTGR